MVVRTMDGRVAVSEGPTGEKGAVVNRFFSDSLSLCVSNRRMSFAYDLARGGLSICAA